MKRIGSKNIFRSGQQVSGSKMGQPLNYCGSKVYAQVGLGQGPSLALLSRIRFDNLVNIFRKLNPSLFSVSFSTFCKM